MEASPNHPAEPEHQSHGQISVGSGTSQPARGAAGLSVSPDRCQSTASRASTPHMNLAAAPSCRSGLSMTGLVWSPAASKGEDGGEGRGRQ